MKFGSVCSGIEAASVAWKPLGWKPAWFAEIEAYPSALLAHHYPTVANLGDMTTIASRIAAGEIEAPDVLVGGTPCQAFSVAGARQSLDDERGQLTLEFVRLANEIDKHRSEPAVIVWENVPGVLNTKDNAFGCFLGALAGESRALEPTGGRWGNAGCVFGPQRSIAWRILDAQFFGVAQRRRRVFVVASARGGFNPAKVLFEWDGVRRDIAPSRNAGQETTGSAGGGIASPNRAIGTLCARDIKGVGNQYVGEGKLVIPTDYAPANDNTAFIQCQVVHGTQHPIIRNNQAHPLGRNMGQENVVFGIQANTIGRLPQNGGNGLGACEEIAPTLTKSDRHGVATGTARRLTPVECERLQGFSDGYTLIPFRNKPAILCPDGQRYAALGNSMAVPVMAWIGRRIAAANDNIKGQRDARTHKTTA